MTPAVTRHTNSFFNSVTYRIGTTIIDPGDDVSFEDVKTVLLTHVHFDHIYGLNRLMEMNPEAKVYTNEHGRKALFDTKLNMSKYNERPFVFNSPEAVMIVENYQQVSINEGLTAKATYTPGHDPSCITWIIEDAIFTGDSFIPGAKTVTTLPHGNKSDAKNSELLIMNLSKGRIIHPGHKV